MAREVTIHHGDSREVLKTLADASIDSVVCDPPYALVSIGKRFGAENAAPVKVSEFYDEGGKSKGSSPYLRASSGFMGKTWDTGETAFAVEFWAEVYRVLKPGGHVVAFSGTRTYHRMTCAIEDAGFEIRDMLSWLYGSGFPKSHDVSKGIDKAAGAVRKIVGEKRAGLARKARGGGDMVGHESFEELRRADITVPTTPEAAQWSGWGTALKPACEPIVLARKPLSGTVAANVLAHGTGALNIDGCRVGEGEQRETKTGGMARKSSPVYGSFANDTTSDITTTLGRWPANVLHDGSDEVVEAFPDSKDGVAGKRGGVGGISTSGLGAYDGEWGGYGGEGSAARFFYTAKADATDRLGSKHPTIKPTDLMRWLCRLVTPPGGLILDPFAGSGSTGVAAIAEGFDAILIEREDEYVADIRRRIAWAKGEGRLTMLEKKSKPAPKRDDGPSIFGDAA